MAGPAWAEAVAQANAEAKQPVLLLRDARLPAAVWPAWADVFDEAGYAALIADFPLDGEPGRGLGVLQIRPLVLALNNRPAVVGHGAGGLIAGNLARDGLTAAAVAVAPDPQPDWPAGMRSGSGGPLLVIAGPRTSEPPPFVGGAATEFLYRPEDPAALMAGPAWREVAEASLSFIQRFV